MQTNYSAIALGAMVMTLSAAAAGVGQDRIPGLQKEVRTRTEPASVTLTGCVARGLAAGSYILTNITKDERTTAQDAFVGTSVLLSSTDVDVSKHVGHRVSVTGVYSSDGRATSVTAMDKPAPTNEVARGDKLTSGNFRVKSLAMVADSCSQTADQG
jgi:hypothetical protein